MSFEKGKVTPRQIACIVDRYLCDNNFSQTRFTFRSEASSLFNSPINEVPKSLMSLGVILDEYTCLREQKLLLDQERVIFEQEKSRVQMLLHGMQNAMNAYDASQSLALTNISAMNMKSAVVPQPKLGVPATGTTTPINAPPFTTTTMQNASNIHQLSQSKNTNAEKGNFSAPIMSVSESERKRKDTKSTDAPSIAKKPRGRPKKRTTDQGQNTLTQPSSAANSQVALLCPSASQSSVGNCVARGSQVEGSSVVKSSLEPSLSIPTTSPVSKTPPRTIYSHNDPHISPSEISSIPTCNEEATPTKQMASVESSHCISPLKTDSVNMLALDAFDMPESLDKSFPNEISKSESALDVDIYDYGFDGSPMDFTFPGLISDMENPSEGIGFPYQPAANHSGISYEYKANEVIPELLSSATEALSGKDMNIPGPDSLTATNSVSKCIEISGPREKQPAVFESGELLK